MRFSPLTQLTPANVAQLETAWVYHMKPATPAGEQPAANPGGLPGGGGRGRGLGGGGFAPGETTPLVVNGVMYVSTPYGRVVALDPTTGKEVWVYKLPAGNPATRGVEYFAGDARRRRRRLCSARQTASSIRSMRKRERRARTSA
jgi:quinoprotein glucose dehydrogenase